MPTIGSGLLELQEIHTSDNEPYVGFFGILAGGVKIGTLGTTETRAGWTRGRAGRKISFRGRFTTRYHESFIITYSILHDIYNLVTYNKLNKSYLG
jgi:hypothetical protein